MKPLLLLLFVLATFSSVSTYKILFYTNLFGHSHVKFLGAAADTLTDAGHDVTVLMPVFDDSISTSLKSTKNVIFVNGTEEVVEFSKMRSKMLANMWTLDSSNPFGLLMRVRKMSALFGSQCRQVLSDQKLIEKIKNENFDLAITEPFDTCAYAFFEAIQIRAHVAVLSSSRLEHVSDVIGQPAALSYNPGLMSNYNDRMTIGQRFINTIQYSIGSFFFSFIGDNDFKISQEINPTWRSWRETVPEASFVLTNQIPLLDFPSPTFDKIIPVGGLSVKTDKKSMKLEQKWSKILELRKKNVFISFGSNAKSRDMPEEFKQSLLTVFRSMPDTTFIWKYEDISDKLTQGIDNVFLGDWLPQNELLADKRLNVFVTHGGLGSVTELSMMGKPCVMIPLFADQSRNAQMLKRHGGAAVLSKTDLSNPKLVQETIEKVLSDPKFQENAEKLAEKLLNQPTNPKETLVKYVEFAARFGKLPSLDNHGRHQSFVEYFLIDIISLVVLVISIVGYIVYRTLRFCCRGRNKKVEGKNKKD